MALDNHWPQPIVAYPGNIEVTCHYEGPELGYFWRIDEHGMGNGQDWNGVFASPDEANIAAIRWCVSQAKQLYRLENDESEPLRLGPVSQSSRN